MNYEIRLSPINVVDQDGKSLGVLETHEAMRMAEEAGLDLVEIQANVRPPLCKIMDYGKYKYELSKKAKGQKNKAQEQKEVRLGRSAKIDPHDVEIRVNQARKFLMQGHKVLIVQRFRGREMQHKDIGLDRLTDIAKSLDDISKIETPPRQAGRQMTMVLNPDRQRIEQIKRKLEAAKAKEAKDKDDQKDSKAEDAPTTEATPEPKGESTPTEPEESVKQG